jgi:hypothetical protein
MKAMLFCLFVIPALVMTPVARAEEVKSPDGQLAMIKAEAVDTAGEYQLQRVTLRRGDAILWEYACSARALLWEWSGDSRHCLFAVSNGARDMSLFTLTIDPDFSPRFQELDLAAVHEEILKRFPDDPDLPGGWAPVSYVDWKTIRWVEPKKCEMVFIDKGEGLDSEARLRVELGEDRSKLTIVEIKDNFPARMKAKGIVK